MTIVALLAQSTAVPVGAASLAGPYIISGLSLVSVVGVIFRAGVWMGSFREFKEQYEKDKNRSGEHVTQNEMQFFVKHIDTRFDEVSRQLAELRKMKLEGQQR